MKRKNKVTTLEQRHQEREVKEAFKQNYVEYQEKLEKYLKASPDHKRPVTRRDFLEVGFWTSSVSLLGPSMETLMERLNPAYGQTLDCPGPVASKSVPFLHFHMSGGTMPFAYVTPTTADGQLLANYSRLGLGPATPTFDNTLFANGALVYNNQSNGAGAGFHTGWLEATNTLGATIGAEIRSKTACFVVPWVDNGDSDNFPFSIMGLVAAAGQSGEKLGVLGTNASATGADAGILSAYNIFAATPLRVQAVTDIERAVAFGGALDQLSVDQKVKMVRTIESLSVAQKTKIMGYSGGANAAKLIECATGQNVENIEKGPPAVNPATSTQATQLASIWNNFNPLVTAGNKTFDNRVNSLIAFNVANGNAAAGAINIGNHDQHASHNNRTEQEQSAYAIARQIGQSIATAHILGKKMMIELTMNGSCVTGGGTPTSKFDNDDNSGDCTGGAIVFMYDPAGHAKSTALQAKYTIGGIVSSTNLGQNGRVDRTPFTSNVLLAQTAVFYNYCLFRGDPAAFDKVLSNNPLTAAQKLEVKKIG